MSALLLDQDTWDLVVDAFGNIALADRPYAIAQDVACACRLFSGELFYDTTKGVPYFPHILAKAPPLGVVKAAYVQAAFTVSGVVAAQVFLSDFTDRVLTGQVQVTDNLGNTLIATLSPLPSGFAFGVSGFGTGAF